MSGRARIERTGKKDALPPIRFKYSIRYCASSDVGVTIFCIAPPIAVSIAVSYFASVKITSATTPWILSPKSGLVFALDISVLTVSEYPSNRFFIPMYISSVSLKDASCPFAEKSSWLKLLIADSISSTSSNFSS